MLAVANVSDAVDNERNVLLASASLAEILARNRFGIAIAANRAIIATTIMISTNVKPLRLFFILGILLSGSGFAGLAERPIQKKRKIR